MLQSTSISQREAQVLKMIAFEHTTKEIANHLYISHHTVVTHRKKLQKKFQVKNCAGLVRRAFELGFLGVSSQTA